MMDTSLAIVYGGVFCLSLLASVVLTPFARRLAMYCNFYDAPSDRKLHTKLTPYLGGLALYLGFVIGLISVLGYRHQLTGLVVGATFMFLLGLIDDKHGMHPKIKLFGQIVAGLAVVNAEVHFSLFQNLWLDVPLTLFWIVGITNAINFLDNMDGLSSGVAAISATFMFLIAARNGQFLVASLAVALAGACIGFLRYNFSPASIFMGDSGSMFLGFMLATTGVKLRLPAEGTFSGFIVPVLVLGLPILDTTLVTLQRWANNRPVYQGGKDHCSHRLVALGLSHRQAVLVLYGVTACYAGCAFLLDPTNVGLAAPIMAAAIVFSLAVFLRLSSVPVYQTVRTSNEGV